MKNNILKALIYTLIGGIMVIGGLLFMICQFLMHGYDAAFPPILVAIIVSVLGFALVDYSTNYLFKKIKKKVIIANRRYF